MQRTKPTGGEPAMNAIRPVRDACSLRTVEEVAEML